MYRATEMDMVKIFNSPEVLKSATLLIQSIMLISGNEVEELTLKKNKDGEFSLDFKLKYEDSTWQN